MFSGPVWKKNRKLGEFLGVKYYSSNEWTTTRARSGLNIPNIPFSKYMLGFNARFGDVEFIKSFKQRQRQPVADFKITLEKGRRSFVELEREVLALWHYELKKCYELPLEQDEFLIERMDAQRRTIGDSSIFNQFKRFYKMMWSQRAETTRTREAMKKLTDEEAVLYFIPFLTMIDTFILCLAFKSYGENLSDFFDKVPIKYMGMYDGDTPVMCELTNNGMNNPGNSVFGPKGCVCPGSHVTTEILKAMKDYCNTHEWDIEGEPRQFDKQIASISNPEECFITIY